MTHVPTTMVENASLYYNYKFAWKVAPVFFREREVGSFTVPAMEWSLVVLGVPPPPPPPPARERLGDFLEDLVVVALGDDEWRVTK